MTMHEHSLSDRQSAVLGFITLEGGWDEFLARGGQLIDLLPLLNENQTSDALDCLTHIGRQPNIPRSRNSRDGEPIIDPTFARDWLVESRLATTTDDGSLYLTTDNPSHVTLGWLHIASGGEPMLLSNAYREVSFEGGELSHEILSDIAKAAVESSTTSRPASS